MNVYEPQNIGLSMNNEKALAIDRFYTFSTLNHIESERKGSKNSIYII